MTLGTRIVVLKDGVIQQVDTPQNLYDKPANKFVAGFIGSPQMNLIDAKVVQVGNQVHVQFGNADITLPDEKGKVLVRRVMLVRKFASVFVQRISMMAI